MDSAIGVRPMSGEVVRREPVQFGLRGLNGLGALLNIAAEFERKPGGLFVQRLQAAAGGFVLVHTGQTVAEQRALDVVPGSRAGAIQIDSRKCVVNLAVQAEGAAGNGHPLRLPLCLVAHGAAGGHRVQHSGLRSSQIQLLDCYVIEQQRVIRRAQPLDRQ